MKKVSNKVSVVTLPLKTEPWQTDKLNRIFESCRCIYNAMLSRLMKEYRKLKRDPRYIEYSERIRDCYNDTDPARRSSSECRLAIDERNRLFKEYGFTAFDFTNLGTECYDHYKEIVPSIVKNRSITKPLWGAFSDMFYKNGKQVRYKKTGDWNSIASDGKSGLRLVDREDRTLRQGTLTEPMWLYVGTREGKPMRIPVVIPEKDDWKGKMVCRPIRVIRVIRKKVRGADKYFLQLTVEGETESKTNSRGEEKHPRGTGKVGVYIEPRSVTAANGNEVKTFWLNRAVTFPRQKRELMRFLESSKRATNPENYNPDGTIKTKKQRKAPLTWNYSNHYKAARAKLADLYRVEAENRRLERQKIANELMQYGNEFIVNEGPAPGLLIQLLKQKAESEGRGSVRTVSIGKVEKVGNYKERQAKELYYK